MTADQVGGIVRALLAALGGYFVGQGLIDAEAMTTIGGSLATLIVTVWSVWSKRNKPDA